MADNPESFVQYFDRLELYEFGSGDGSGMLQVVWKYINRKFRVELEKYRNYALVNMIKEQYLNAVREWFGAENEPF